MKAVGINSVLRVKTQVPDILCDLMRTMREGGDLDNINLLTADTDPSKMRDITDPIYQECWWQAEVPVGGDDLLGQFAILYHVSRSDNLEQ